jgi:hypothetical protein
VGVEHVPARLALGVGIGLYARPVQANGAIAEDRKVEDVAVRRVDDHLRLQYLSRKIRIGSVACRFARVQELQGLLYIKRTVYASAPASPHGGTITLQRQTPGGPPGTTEYATPRYFILTERWGVQAVPPRALADCLRVPATL